MPALLARDHTSVLCVVLSSQPANGQPALAGKGVASPPGWVKWVLHPVAAGVWLLCFEAYLPTSDMDLAD